jgi:hypothetical protein
MAFGQRVMGLPGCGAVHADHEFSVRFSFNTLKL